MLNSELRGLLTGNQFQTDQPSPRSVLGSKTQVKYGKTTFWVFLKMRESLIFVLLRVPYHFFSSTTTTSDLTPPFHMNIRFRSTYHYLGQYLIQRINLCKITINGDVGFPRLGFIFFELQNRLTLAWTRANALAQGIPDIVTLLSCYAKPIPWVSLTTANLLQH